MVFKGLNQVYGDRVHGRSAEGNAQGEQGMNGGLSRRGQSWDPDTDENGLPDSGAWRGRSELPSLQPLGAGARSDWEVWGRLGGLGAAPSCGLSGRRDGAGERV